jgi:peptide/nickel transport system ATP-binding protein
MTIPARRVFWKHSSGRAMPLSGGQRQRVAIARALAVDPEVILADEPISMLDVSIRMGVLNLIEQLKEERGIAYLYITHDIASARYIADQTIVMYAGYMVEGAGSDELMQQPAHPYTHLLLSAVPNPQASERHTIEARGEVPSLNDQHWTRCQLYGSEEKTGSAVRNSLPSNCFD